MQALHGKDYAHSLNHLVPGCRGIKEITWIVLSDLLRPKPGEAEQTYGFRPTVGDGLTKGQKTLKARVEAQIKRVQIGVGLAGVGANKWEGDAKPVMQFMSFRPQAEENLVYDALIIPIKLQHRVRDVGNWREFNVEVMRKTFATQQEVEVGFEGSREGVDMAKSKIKKRLVSLLDNKNLHIANRGE